jgi:hypothetical protein
MKPLNLIHQTLSLNADRGDYTTGISHSVELHIIADRVRQVNACGADEVFDCYPA